MEEILRRLQEIDDELRAIDTEAGDARLTDDQQTRFDELVTERTELENARAREERRAQVRSRIEAGRTAVETPEDGIAARSVNMPGVNSRGTRDVYEVARRHDAGVAELRDAALQVIEDRVPDRAEWRASAERLVRRDHRGDVARYLVNLADPVYERAWAKVVTGNQHLLEDDERRAIAVGTNTQGGYLVPTHLDPTILLTNDGTINPFRRISRVVTLGPNQGNVWNGVTSAGVTAGDAGGEMVEVGDNSPGVDDEGIPVHKAHAFVEASFEAFEDIPGLAEDVVMMLGDARDRLDSQRFATGTGTNQPTGIFTALDANTNVEIETTTQGTLGAVDIYGVEAAVPPRFRGQASWVMNRSVEHTIRQLGTADPNFTVAFDAAGIPQLLGHGVAESSEAPDGTTTTTEVNNLLVIGDFSRFVIVDKVGMSVEFIPNLFGTTNNRPVGKRGWYAHWRRGSDSVTDNAFRLLQDGTSA